MEVRMEQGGKMQDDLNMHGEKTEQGGDIVHRCGLEQGTGKLKDGESQPRELNGILGLSSVLVIWDVL